MQHSTLNAEARGLQSVLRRWVLNVERFPSAIAVSVTRSSIRAGQPDGQ